MHPPRNIPDSHYSPLNRNNGSLHQDHPLPASNSQPSFHPIATQLSWWKIQQNGQTQDNGCKLLTAPRDHTLGETLFQIRPDQVLQVLFPREIEHVFHFLFFAHCISIYWDHIISLALSFLSLWHPGMRVFTYSEMAISSDKGLACSRKSAANTRRPFLCYFYLRPTPVVLDLFLVERGSWVVFTQSPPSAFHRWSGP